MKLIDILVEELPKRGGWPKRANCITQDGDLKVEPAYCHPSVAKCDDDGFWFLDSSRIGGFLVDTLASDYTTAIITREQYEAALAAKNDGWIDWGGGKCPVDDVNEVDIKFRAGGIVYDVEAGKYYWPRTGQEYDVIAYRLHQPQKAEQAEADDEIDLNECIGQDAEPVWSGEGLPPVGCECEIQFIYDTPPAEWFAFKLIGIHDEIAIMKLDGENTWRHISKLSPVKVKFRPIRPEAELKREEAVKAIMLTGWCQSAAEEVYDLVAAGKVPGIKLED